MRSAGLASSAASGRSPDRFTNPWVAFLHASRPLGQRIRPMLEEMLFSRACSSDDLRVSETLRVSKLGRG